MKPHQLASSEKLCRAKHVLKALSNKRRLLLLCQLTDGERTVTELVDFVGAGQSSISQYLARLREDGLVKTRRSAQTVYYSQNGPEAITLIATLYRVYCGRG